MPTHKTNTSTMFRKCMQPLAKLAYILLTLSQ